MRVNRLANTAMRERDDEPSSGAFAPAHISVAPGGDSVDREAQQRDEWPIEPVGPIRIHREVGHLIAEKQDSERNQRKSQQDVLSNSAELEVSENISVEETPQPVKMNWQGGASFREVWVFEDLVQAPSFYGDCCKDLN
jgi:hypothetical protein